MRHETTGVPTLHKKAIISITGTYVESISLEEIVARENWVADQILPEKAELQQLVSDILENPHDMPPEQKALPGIHRGDVNYAGVQEYLPFREMYEPWKLPKDRLVPLDEILQKTPSCTYHGAEQRQSH